jgi:hypothetical protein
MADLVLWGDAQRVRGLNLQPGLYVLRPDYVAFLPSQPERNLAASMALVGAGFFRIEGEAARYDLKALWLQSPEAFDEAVESWAVQRQTREDVELILGEPIQGQRTLVVRSDADNQLICQLRGADPGPLLEGWAMGKPRFDAPQMKRVLGVITFVPALFAVICGLVAFFGDDKMAYLGVPFWGVLVVLGWGGYFYAKHKHEKTHGPDAE